VQGSAVTYMRRYAYCAVLNLVADVDDDGNSATASQNAQPKSSRRPAQPATHQPFEDRPPSTVRQPPGTPRADENGELVASTQQLNKIRKILNDQHQIHDEPETLRRVGDSIGRAIKALGELTPVEATQAIVGLTGIEKEDQ
jgi:hypothetical protein